MPLTSMSIWISVFVIDLSIPYLVIEAYLSGGAGGSEDTGADAPYSRGIATPIYREKVL